MRLNMANDIRSNRHSRIGGKRRKQMERCVLCWRMTDVPQDTPLSHRRYYVQGQGQLCENCYYELFKQGVFSGEDNADL